MTGTPSPAAVPTAPGDRRARTSSTMPAPAATAARMTSGREVSTDRAAVALRVRASTPDTTRSSSSVGDGGGPGRDLGRRHRSSAEVAPPPGAHIRAAS